jgi:Na+/H+-dicarboxylate symporter
MPASPRVGAYFLAATLAAIALGVAAALIIEPGTGLGGQLAIEAAPSAISVPRGGQDFDPSSIMKVLLPRNPLASMVSGEMLSILAFALISALALRNLPRTSSAPILQLLGAVQEICMIITGLGCGSRPTRCSGSSRAW